VDFEVAQKNSLVLQILVNVFVEVPQRGINLHFCDRVADDNRLFPVSLVVVFGLYLSRTANFLNCNNIYLDDTYDIYLGIGCFIFDIANRCYSSSRVFDGLVVSCWINFADLRERKHVLARRGRSLLIIVHFD
jgi:hypothetical protein